MVSLLDLLLFLTFSLSIMLTLHFHTCNITLHHGRILRYEIMQQTSLTPRQQEFFIFLQNAQRRNGTIPSLRSAAQELGISHTAVAGLLRVLQEKGWIRRGGRYSRKITLLDTEQVKTVPSTSAKRIPVIGRVAAGLPLYAQQEWAGFIMVDGNIYRGDSLFALQVQGDSMKDIGILEGDLALCEPRQFAENGEIIVALINHEEATIKRFFYRGDHIELKPENKNFPTLSFALGEVLIQGRLIGIHRGPEQMARL